MSTDSKRQNALDIQPDVSEQLYRAMVEFVQSRGARREELGSGWWWCEAFGTEERGLGDAVEFFLRSDGVDLRDAIPGEIDGEYWG